VEKMKNRDYTIDMSYWSKFLESPKNEQWSGEEVHNLIEGIYEDFLFHNDRKRKVNPATALYYRDLLSYLIKTYGH